MSLPTPGRAPGLRILETLVLAGLFTLVFRFPAPSGLGYHEPLLAFLFPALMAQWTDASGAVDYRTLFMVPAGMAVVAILLLAVFFRPAERAPTAVVAA